MIAEARTQALLPDATDASALRHLIMGFRMTQLLYVAAKLGVADHLQDGPQSLQYLARAVGAEPMALYRVLRALASLGIFAETAAGDFALTPQARLLCSQVPGSLRSLAILYGEDWYWQAYGDMLYSVKTGQPAFPHIHHHSLYDYLRQHPPAASLFHAAMSGYTGQEAAAILAAYDFAGISRLVDIGGGYGALMADLVRAYPYLSGVVFDLAEVVAGARRHLAEAGLTERCTCVAGDFFVEAPVGGDVYLLKSILHNWDDAACVRILRNVREVMPPHGRLLVAERVVPAGNAPAEAKLFDINMLVVLGGQERTASEYRTLFQAAGFTLSRVIPTQAPLSLIEGMPAA